MGNKKSKISFTRPVSAPSAISLEVRRSILKTRLSAPHSRSRHVSYSDFKGLMAPVYTIFKNDGPQSVELEHIDRYAQWLKEQNINGILVNGFTGEGPALGIMERIETANAWWKAAVKYDLLMMLNVGGAPLPDVLEMADHAEKLGVHSVVCLPELLYKPTTIDELVGYLRLVAKTCPSTPFFYYHLPNLTGVYMSMADVCQRAEDLIANFFGIIYDHVDLGDGEQCLREGRVVILANSYMLASGMLLGFDSALMTFFNSRPDLGWLIYNAMLDDDMDRARDTQVMVNEAMNSYVSKFLNEDWIEGMKQWFDAEVASGNNNAGFSVGKARKFY